MADPTGGLSPTAISAEPLTLSGLGATFDPDDQSTIGGPNGPLPPGQYGALVNVAGDNVIGTGATVTTADGEPFVFSFLVNAHQRTTKETEEVTDGALAVLAAVDRRELVLDFVELSRPALDQRACGERFEVGLELGPALGASVVRCRARFGVPCRSGVVRRPGVPRRVRGWNSPP